MFQYKNRSSCVGEEDEIQVPWNGRNDSRPPNHTRTKTQGSFFFWVYFFFFFGVGRKAEAVVRQALQGCNRHPTKGIDNLPGLSRLGDTTPISRNRTHKTKQPVPGTSAQIRGKVLDETNPSGSGTGGSRGLPASENSARG